MTNPAHLQKIPHEIISDQILPYVPELLSSGKFRLISRSWNQQIFPIVVELFWKHCSLNPPSAIKEDLPKFQRTTLDKFDSKTPILLKNATISKWMKGVFFKSGLVLKKEERFMPYAITASLQSQLDAELDVSLMNCWVEIRRKLPYNPSLPDEEASAIDIRSFLNTSSELMLIRELDFSNIGLSCLPPEIRLFQNLRKLNLNQNKLTYLNLSSLPHLKSISVEGNQLTSAILNNLPELKSAHLNNNYLMEVVFCETPLLTRLHLHNNFLPRFTTKSLPNLRHLHLEGNFLTTIEIEYPSQLISVYLTNNKLEQFSLSDIQQLESLSLGKNKLTRLHLKNLPVLKALHLKQNCDLREFTAEGIFNIEELDIQGCPQRLQVPKELLVKQRV